MQNKFLVVSPTYNVAPYIEKCIMSVLNQTYRNFEFIVVDDCCTDGTTEIIQRLYEEHPDFKVHRNAVRTESALGNFLLGISLCPGNREDIIVTVDGDDWFYDDNVFEYLNGVYQDPVIWMTYGSFVLASGNPQSTCEQLKDSRTYRRHDKWVTSHLRTIKRKLWDMIADRDLRDSTGKYYVYYADTAYMFPAIEMAGLKHSRFINKILYVYNDKNPLCSSDDWKTKPKIDMKKVYDISREIRKKSVYPELREL